MRNLFEEIWSTVRQNKLRTALTGFAVAWGIFMLIVMLGAGNGVMNALMNNSGMIENSMTIYSGFTSKAYAGFDKWRRIELDSRDVDILEEGYFSEHVDGISPVIQQGDTLVYGEYFINGLMMGVTPEFGKIQKIDLVCGRFINVPDMNENRRMAIIGSNEAELFAGKDDMRSLLGKDIRIGAFSYKIAGIYKSPEDEFGDIRIYVPFNTLNRIYAKGNEIPLIFLSFHGIDDEESNEFFQDRYRRAVNNHHNAAPDDNNTVYIWNKLISNMQMSKAIRILNTALWILGIFTLLSGIVGVSNIMLITVRERTHEFGIRKALGAGPGSILKLIIAESISITTFFGYIGMVSGLLVNHIMDITMSDSVIDTGIAQVTMFVNPTVGIDVAVKATLVLIIAGTLAGLIPAGKASRVRPIEALRAE